MVQDMSKKPSLVWKSSAVHPHNIPYPNIKAVCAEFRPHSAATPVVPERSQGSKQRTSAEPNASSQGAKTDPEERRLEMALPVIRDALGSSISQVPNSARSLQRHKARCTQLGAINTLNTRSSAKTAPSRRQQVSNEVFVPHVQHRHLRGLSSPACSARDSRLAT